MFTKDLKKVGRTGVLSAAAIGLIAAPITALAPAQAATVDSIIQSIESSEVHPKIDDVVTITAGWTVSEDTNPQAGDTLTLQLPEELTAETDTIEVKDANGIVIANGVINENNSIIFTITEEGQTLEEDLSGSFSLDVKVNENAVSNKDIVISWGGQKAIITPENKDSVEEAGNEVKVTGAENENKENIWRVEFPGGYAATVVANSPGDHKISCDYITVKIADQSEDGTLTNVRPYHNPDAVDCSTDIATVSFNETPANSTMIVEFGTKDIDDTNGDGKITNDVIVAFDGEKIDPVSIESEIFNPEEPEPTDPTDPTDPGEEPGGEEPVDPEPTDPTDPVDPQPTDPTDPVDPEPTDPTEPTDPVDPDPTTPTTPVDPEPTDPPVVVPTTPTTPNNPTTPTEPTIPTEPTTPNDPTTPTEPTVDNSDDDEEIDVPSTPIIIPSSENDNDDDEESTPERVGPLERAENNLQTINTDPVDNSTISRYVAEDLPEVEETSNDGGFFGFGGGSNSDDSGSGLGIRNASVISPSSVLGAISPSSILDPLEPSSSFETTSPSETTAPSDSGGGWRGWFGGDDSQEGGESGANSNPTEADNDPTEADNEEGAVSADGKNASESSNEIGKKIAFIGIITLAAALAGYFGWTLLRGKKNGESETPAE